MSRTHNAGIVTAYGAAVRGGYTGTYEEFCAQQAQYAENARQMEQAVSDVRQIKTSVESAVSEAEGYANNANQSATNASNSATQASQSASNANQSAESASQFANNASNSANSASQSATSAQTSANNASTSERNAQQSAEDAQDILESVQTEGNTQISRVQAKGQEVLDSLPEDFTEVQQEISKINGSLGALKADLKANTEDLYKNVLVDDLRVKFIGNYLLRVSDGLLYAYAGYDTYVVYTDTIKTFVLKSLPGSYSGYFADYPSDGSTTIDATAHTNVMGETTVPNECNYLVVCIPTGRSPVTASTEDDTVVDKINNIQNMINGMTISGYTKTNTGTVILSQYKTAGKFVYLNTARTGITSATNTSYNYYTVPTAGLCKITVTNGYNGTALKTIIFTDAGDNVIDYFPKVETPSPGQVITITCFVPEGATKAYINEKPGLAQVSVTYPKASFSSSAPAAIMATETSEGVYQVGLDDYLYTVDTGGSYNGLFNYTNLDRDNSTFKAVTDDITPMHFATVGYVGANHGYYFAYDCTITGHGLTESAIGSTYTDGNSITWVLLKIVSANVIEVCAYSSSNWWKMQTATVPGTLNFGSALTVESSERKQIYPSVKNGTVTLAENTADRAVFVESYDIIDIGVGLDALITNVGNNTNDSIVALSDAIVTVRNLYEFQPNGVVITKGNAVIRKADRPLSFYGGIQSQPFATGDYFAVAGTSLKSLQTTNNVSVDIRRTSWDSSTVPPFIYEQAKPSNGSYSQMFFTGFVADTASRNALINSLAGSFNKSYKMYPFFVAPDTALDAGATINFKAFRLPAYLNEMSRDVPFVSYFELDGDYYLIVKTLGALTASITLPAKVYGKNVETILSESVSTTTEVVINAIDVVSTAEGTLFVKLS